MVIEGDLLAINCKGNKLSAVDCSSSDKLVLLDCSENQLGQMDISALASAKYVYLMNNSITNLITGELPLLEELNVSFNGLTSVNLAKFIIICLCHTSVRCLYSKTHQEIHRIALAQYILLTTIM